MPIMKNVLLLYFLSVFSTVFCAKSQVDTLFFKPNSSFLYDFPHWCADLNNYTQWKIGHCFDNPSNGSDAVYFSLQGLQPDSAASSWSFSMRHAYPPSSANNWAFILYADAFDLSTFPFFNAYVLGVNVSGSDDILKLWKVENGKYTVVIDTRFNFETSVSIEDYTSFRVLRSVSGEWTIQITNSEGVLELGVGTDKFSFPAVASGLYYRYSSSQDQKLFVENSMVSGVFIADTICPFVQSVEVVNDHAVRVVFSEAIVTDSIQVLLHNDILKVEKIEAISNSEIDIVFLGSFQQDVLYRFNFADVKDMSANRMDDLFISFTYKPLKMGDIIISEVLPDPKTYCKRFVELYNNTNAPIKMAGIELIFFPLNANDKVKTLSLLSCNDIIDAGQYLFISDDTLNIQQNYIVKPFGKAIQVTSFFALDEKEGIIALYYDKKLLLDSMFYNQNMFHSMLSKNEGVSLERYHINHEAGYHCLWQSAASTSGFATPGYENSRFNMMPHDSLNLMVQPIPFTPNNDGIDDYLNIKFAEKEWGSVANIAIFDMQGVLLKTICNHIILGSYNQFTWDGSDESGKIMERGIYILYIELYALNGSKQVEKKVVVIH